jgi:UDP-glucose 4-epimerase
MKVLVTGCSGYIGGQTAIKLKDLGHHVVGVDWQILPTHLRPFLDKFIHEDFGSQASLLDLMQLQPDAVIHCAGTSLVGPSATKPALYYDNNFVKTKRMLDTLVSNKFFPRIVFSSSAAVYGETLLPCKENDHLSPISPYGESKLMVEQMLRSYRSAYGVDSVSFRYFNACGADPKGRHGQAANATHIIARVLESVRDNQQFTLFGTDYDTEDGTCVRDYVHVDDIVAAHVMAINNMEVPQGVYNLGTNQGVSNLEIIKHAIKITQMDLRIVNGQKRAGDPAILTANAERFTAITGWKPKYTVEETIEHAWRWYNR